MNQANYVSKYKISNILQEINLIIPSVSSNLKVYFAQYSFFCSLEDQSSAVLPL